MAGLSTLTRVRAENVFGCRLRHIPGARSFWRTVTIVWGAVYLVESAARVAVILTLPLRHRFWSTEPFLR